jgi:SAM-dependent methyltransferase
MREFDHYRDGYSEQINKAIAFSGQSHDFYIEAKARYLQDLFRRLRKRLPDTMIAAVGGAQPLDVLDVGCGHGLIHRFLRPPDVGVNLTGIDVAGTIIEDAKKANPHVHYDVYDGKRLPYSAQSFDAAFAIAVLHHVPPTSWNAFIAEMRRVVRRGGIVALIEHNPINPLTQRVVRNLRMDDNAVLLGAGRLARLIADAGMVEIERRFILFTPFRGAVFRRLDGLLRWLPLGAQYCIVARVPG